MAEPFLGEIRVFAFNQIPKGWLPCNGQILPIPNNQALYSLLGTTYGGNGTTNFALPNLQGRVPVHVGNSVSAGEAQGEAAHTLTINEMPAHTHELRASNEPGSTSKPQQAAFAQTGSSTHQYSSNANTFMSAAAMTPAGQSQPHNNMQPYTVLSFCIATIGIYPSRD
ncbi:phage tail protein [Paenibacillus aquistagni]|uniref:Microcystin-dependent protein n=1 Tax=Paenibacillus aquistagni TaxID=1852522 RepID=A0A1X7LW23_9BACL|nr:tail fiber protein [Paenibacillus aquistagni]SMG57667.1 Microcystin-dependent protein [Paenibacillus aquistagni]